MKRLVLVSVMMLVMTGASNGSELQSTQKALGDAADAIVQLIEASRLRVLQAERERNETTVTRAAEAKQKLDDLSQLASSMREDTLAAAAMMAGTRGRAELKPWNQCSALMRSMEGEVETFGDVVKEREQTLLAVMNRWTLETNLQLQLVSKASSEARELLDRAMTAVGVLEQEHLRLRRMTDGAPPSNGGADLPMSTEAFEARAAATRDRVTGLIAMIEINHKRLLRKHSEQAGAETERGRTQAIVRELFATAAHTEGTEGEAGMGELHTARTPGVRNRRAKTGVGQGQTPAVDRKLHDIGLSARPHFH
jgi:hypothetical protein